MREQVRVAVVADDAWAAPGIVAQRAWEAGREADLVVLPALPTEPDGVVEVLRESAERSALLREKLIRNLDGSGTLVATAIVEFGVAGPGVVGLLVTADGVEDRGFQRRAPDWAETRGGQPAVHDLAAGRVAVLVGEDADGEGLRAAASLGADVVAVPGRGDATRFLRIGQGWRIVEMSDDHVEELLGWHHEPPLDFYDADRFPEDVEQLRDPVWRAQHRVAVVDEDGRMVGHAEFLPDGDVVTIGLGLRPDLMGQRYGEWFVRRLLDAARERFEVQRFDLSVADWNTRAIRVYERAGFVDTGRRTTRPDVTFVEMSAPA